MVVVLVSSVLSIDKYVYWCCHLSDVDCGMWIFTKIVLFTNKKINKVTAN